MTVGELIELLRGQPEDALVFVLDRPHPEGLQIASPDGEDELDFLEISSDCF